MKKSEYDVRAEKFLSETDSTLQVCFTGTRPYFPDDKEARDVYSMTLARGAKSFTFNFGDSIINTEKRKGGTIGTWHKPRAYDVLSCLTKYEPEDVDTFASEYGYTKPSEALREYEAVKREYEALADLYTEEEMEALREIA